MANSSRLTVQDLAPLETLMPEKFPPVWRDMATSLFGALLHPNQPLPLGLQGHPPELAQLAVDLTVALANDIGGDTVYIPIGHFLRAGETASKVISAFRGHNHLQVAKLAGVTVSRVRQILREYQRAEFERRQGKLPL